MSIDSANCQVDCNYNIICRVDSDCSKYTIYDDYCCGYINVTDYSDSTTTNSTGCISSNVNNYELFANN